jgi:type IV pilus assembly protein PilC
MQIRPTSLSVDKPILEVIDIRTILETQIGNPVSVKQLMVFSKQFSALIDSGVPIVQCLELLHSQERKGYLKKILLEIKQDIESGAGLAASFSRFPKVFSEFYIRIVEAGEISGTLDKAFQQLTIQLEKLDRIRSKVIGALLYPAITLVVAFLVLIFMLLKVIPEISKLYTEANATLPSITVMVLGLSNWVENHFILVCVLPLVMIGAWIVLYQLPQFRKVWDPFALKIPLFGSLILKTNVAEFTRTLGTLVSSGVPLLTSFDICLNLIQNYALKESIRRAALFIAEGKTIAAGLASHGLFPPMVIHMVNIGEMTGKLDELLGKVASIYDDEVDDAVRNLTEILQPVIIVVVGVIIAFILLAMYLPIFQFAEKVAG